MNKRLLIGGLGAIAAGALAIGLINWYQDARDHYYARDTTEAELLAAYTKLHGEPSPSIATAPVRIDPSKVVRLAFGGLGLADESANRNMADVVLTD